MNIFPQKKTWLQIFFWCSFWSLVPVLLSGGLNTSDNYLKRSLIVVVAISIVIWANMEILLPKLYFGRYPPLVYVLVGMVLVTVVTMLLDWDSAPWAEYLRRSSDSSGPPKTGNMPSGGRRGMRYLGLAMPLFTAFIGSALFEIAAFANRKGREAAVYKSEKLEAEIKFLKSQINPHFLFNALNNIYTLTLLKSDNAPDHLLKLSGMLRYMLYECKAETVQLQQEIAYLRHFIDLHMLKDSSGLNVKVFLDESRPHLKIAPMLLIPFVENAFKHSKIEDLTHGWITIELRTDAQRITLEVANSLPGHHTTKDKVGGIGLINVQRQLELLYPDHHQLEITEEDGAFRVRLSIDHG